MVRSSIAEAEAMDPRQPFRYVWDLLPGRVSLRASRAAKGEIPALAALKLAFHGDFPPLFPSSPSHMAVRSPGVSAFRNGSGKP